VEESVRVFQTPKQLYFEFMEPEVLFDGRIDHVKVWPFARYTSNYTPPTLADIYRDFGLMNEAMEQLPWREADD